MKIGWELENMVLIEAPCWLVWQEVCDGLHWPKIGRLSMLREAEDAGFGYTLNPLGLPIRVKAKVTAMRDMQLLGWQGRFWGVRSDVKVRFLVEGENSTRLVFKENLSGLGLLLFSALFSMEKLVKINQTWLQALASQIEQNFRQLDSTPVPLS